MPTAPVDDKGTVLYFEDSGAPLGSKDYVTLVLVHGTCFHSAVYRPTIPFAAEHNLRLVLLNMRGYPGSTDYSRDELDELRKPSAESSKKVMAARGVELAAFIRWFIEKEEIPPIQKRAAGHGHVGGLSLLSWSGGNSHTVALFANLDKISGETQDLLEKYLRSFIMYDPSSSVIGSKVPLGLSVVQRDPLLAVDAQVAIFSVAVSSYYPPYAIPDTIDPTPTFDPPRRPLDDVNPKYTPTTSKMTAEVLRSLTHPPVMKELQHLMWGVSADVLNANLVRALYDCRFDDGTRKLRKVWPDLRVHVILCDMTLGECAWAVTVIWDGHRKANPEHRRNLEVHKLEDANHFVHWEEPERFLRFLASIV
ncbi:alpha/beta-hydrolase [Trametes punicea]|nr:alpha/beta-hydrolase [Trametes punicea]